MISVTRPIWHSGAPQFSAENTWVQGARSCRVVVSVAALAVTLLGVPAARASAAEPPSRFAAGARPFRGAAAVARLGDRLDNVAARHHVSAAKLEHMLRSDATLSLDPNDQLFYTEPTLAPAEVAHAAGDDAPVVAATDSGADTFELHSRAGSPRTIYLDFDGSTVTGTGWTSGYTGGASCTTDGFNSEGSSSTFSTNEQAIIRSVWARVSEDYAPWDVDVTTEDPGYAALHRTDYTDEVFGTRALITSSTLNCANGKTLYQSVCPGGCGGVAYVGVFNYSGSLQDAYQPALIFPNALANDSKFIAEATSHEVGHNLGLSHDGATTGCGTGGTSACGYYYGQGLWAPIMGVGYNKPLVQWSKGEYTVANNTEDDFAIFASSELDLVADDYGNTDQAATELDPLDVDAEGLITTRTDVDVFTVLAGSGSATFTVTPSGTSPNLDASLTLRDENDNVVATNDPTSAYASADTATGLDATITTTLTAGRYYLAVDGVGSGNNVTGYSDYASLGAYELTGTVFAPDPAPPTTPKTVSAAPRNGATAVTWAHPASSGSAAVSDYVVSVYASDGGAASGVTGATVRNVGSAATSYTFTGLTNGTTYLVTVAATNSVGTGSESSGVLVTPDGTAPVTTMSKPAGMWTMTTVVPVAWTSDGDPGGAGVASYDVARRSASHSSALGAASTWLSATAAKTANLSGSYGSTYCFKARTRDHAANVSPYTAEQCTAIPLTSGSLSYSHGWSEHNVVGSYVTLVRATTAQGTRVARPSITAKRVALVATTCPTCGAVKVYWNGTYKGTIDMRSATTKRQQLLTLFTLPSASAGNLELVVATSGRMVAIEGLGVSKV